MAQNGAGAQNGPIIRGHFSFLTRMGGALSSRKSSRSKFDDDENSKHEFLWTIFQWEPEWLDDPKYDKEPPPIFEEGKPMIATSLFYENFEEYCKAMEPLMLLEFFHALKKDSDDFLDRGGSKNRSITGTINCCHCNTVNGCKERRIQYFALEAEIPKSLESTYPIRGELVRLKYGEKQEVFGYIEDISRDSITSYSSTGVACCQDRKCRGCISKLVYKIRTKDVTIEKSYKDNMKLTSVIVMTQYLRLLRALSDFPESPLLDSVLKPTSISYRMSEADIETVTPLISGEILNKTQMEVIAGIVKTVAEPETRICLIQGPPGTGKSAVIVNTILEILKNSKQKILVCAPSNKGVDEIVLRLLAKQNIIEKHDVELNVVRIGRDEAMDPGVKDVSFSNLSFDSQMSGLSISRVKSVSQHVKEENILSSANVIASTLASCFSYKMENVFARNSTTPKLPICIIDEAAQATELGTLIPLMLGIKTLILVGDPKQLPPMILSQDAREHGMDVSLFSRAQKNFENDPWNPLVMLNEQYRMVEPIARWPNNYFYNGMLSSAAKVPSLPLYHYKVFNHNSEQTPSMHANEGEAKLVLNILVTIIKEFHEKNDPIPSIGVITPYHHQRQVITFCLNEFCRKLNRKSSTRRSINQQPRGEDLTNKNSATEEEEETKTNTLYDVLRGIKINTVDGFQGQERDIIIMSCVRSNGIGFVSDPNRLNVSLTRAKHTMILCGNFRTFRRNKMWRDLLTDAEARGDFINVIQLTQPDEIRKHIIKENL